MYLSDRGVATRGNSVTHTSVHTFRRTRHELQAHPMGMSLLNRPRAGPAIDSACTL